MNKGKIFSPYKLGGNTLKNRIVMAPLTRSRAINNTPGNNMAEYYRQRSGAGLIITEGTSPSPNGLGYPRMPGIFNEEQIQGWRKVTQAVHENNGRIFIQIMHTGRVSHIANLPKSAEVVAPSVVPLAGKMYVDELGPQDYSVPREMTIEDIEYAKAEFVIAAQNAIEAGFDGVELHAANGYLLEQFLSPITNTRNDQYGGSIENRISFVLETVEQVAEAIGKEKVGIRLSPFGTASGMPHYPEIEATYTKLAQMLNKIGIAYIHLVDHGSIGGGIVPVSLKKTIRSSFSKTLILSGGYDYERAEKDLQESAANLIAFGRPFISNPDLPLRLAYNWPLADADGSKFYTATDEGYIDYPVYEEELAMA